MKKIILLNTVTSFIFSSSLSAITLKESLNEVLSTNPTIKEKLHNIRETQQDLGIAQSEYYPSLDYKASIGLAKAGKLNGDIDDVSYRYYTNSLKLTQNLFNGFSTTHKIDYQKARILAAAYHYVENANDLTFQMVGAYLDAIRSYRLLQNAKDNVRVHEKIYRDVQSLYKTGLTTRSEMTKVRSSLALSKANLIVQQNNTMDKEYRFKKILGRNVDISDFTLPKFEFKMPESIQKASQYAIRNNPSILVSKFNIKGAQSLYKQKKSKYYPQIDFELEQMYNDVSKDNRFDSEDDRSKAYLSLNWNLYSGGAHKADIQKSRSSIRKEVQIQRDLKRQTIEGLELSWSAYEMITKQLKMLYKYANYSQETLSAYKSEYAMGKRGLLDLLSAQNDLINSNTQIINAQMDKLFAQYRILDAMGLLVSSILDKNDYTELTNVIKKPYEIKEDTLPVRLDEDADGIVDSLDICDNSQKGNDINPYGCRQKELDSDFDGVGDEKDICPNTRIGLEVDERGCKTKNSKNKFEAPKDSYIKEFSPRHFMYDNFKIIERFDFINANDINLEDEKFNKKIQYIVKQIKRNEDKDIVVTIIGNTKNMNNINESNKKALEYANNIKDILIKKGIRKRNIVIQARADKDNLFLETDKHSINDVVAVSLYVRKLNSKKVIK